MDNHIPGKKVQWTSETDGHRWINFDSTATQARKVEQIEMFQNFAPKNLLSMNFWNFLWLDAIKKDEH